MKRQLVIGSTLLSAIVFSACSGGGGGGPNPPSATPPPVITRSYSFPAGSASATKGTAWDIIGVKTTLTGQFGNAGGNSYDTLRVDVTFVQDISNALPAPGQPLGTLTGDTQLGVAVLLDVDDNPNTGTFSTCNLSSPLRPFEYASDSGNSPNRLSDGNYSIIGPSGAPIYSGPPNAGSEAVTSVLGSTFTQSFYLQAVGVFDGQAIPKIGVEIGAFNGASVAGVDCVPRLAAELVTS